MNSILRAFGCRKPAEEGSSYEAYVFCCTLTERTGAYFESGKDFIGHPTLKEAIQEYKKNIANGWIPLTVDELKKCGCPSIDENTNTSAPTDDEKEPSLSPTQLENLVGIAENFASDLTEKQPDIVEYMRKLIDDTGMTDQLKTVAPKDLNINMLQEFGEKIMASMDDDKKEQMLNFSQQIVTEFLTKLGGGNSVSNQINELFNASVEDELDDYEEFDQLSDEDKAQHIIQILDDNKTPQVMNIKFDENEPQPKLSDDAQRMLDRIMGTIQTDDTDPLVELVKNAKL
jgi:hypothetical protein